MRREGLWLVAPLAIAFVVFAWLQPADTHPPRVHVSPTTQQTTTSVLGVACVDVHGLPYRAEKCR
jgi:hypothetical protein